ncbi:MAG TPA: IPT/TIG domain-containing protein, partial [Acidobacteriaceae bacterium]|nr:IPT/TIG domain-containing protein [Acidobacteriaceae bacterium]
MNRPSLYLLGALLLATQAQAQTLTSVTPASAPAGSPAQTLLVNGRFQQYPVTVYWTFQNTTTTLAVSNFDGFSQFNATVPASLLTTPGVASIYVTELSSGPSNSLSFTITGGLTSISPNFAQAGGPAFTLTANGNGFSQNTIIVWNGTQLPTTFVSPQQLTTTIPASLIVTAGTASVTIAQPGLTSPSPLPFTIYAPPTLTSINPNSALT